MKNYKKIILSGMFLSLSVLVIFSYSKEASLGIFEKNGDIGKTAITGSFTHNDQNDTYTVTGGGENMWSTTDAFHFVWKKASGDISLAADIQWLGTGGNAHRKACLMIRQSLEPNSAYADAVIHGDGLTSLQYRETAGADTHEIKSNITAPKRIRIEKQGDYVYMSIAAEKEEFHAAGGSFRLKFNDPFYIGLAVCSHDNKVTEKAVFSNVKITSGTQQTTGRQVVESTLETIAVSSTDRTVIYNTTSLIEAPNWTQDNQYLIYNSNGRIYKLPVKGGTPVLIDTGFANRCNNDHGISPDGKQLAISDASERRQSLVYIVPIEGGTPRKITENAPSYWHGWSPDGKTLAYCADRNGNFDIYTISVNGGEETRLTTAEGLDDGPEYSPDGQYIYFNSIRSGTMQIWRMKADGSGQQQLTNDDYNNWFPHISPDGKNIVFLSYEKDVKEHPANKDVMLRLMPANGGQIKVLTKLFGGQGTINVHSWSPNSQNIAFVSYRLVNRN
jgi:TolB protein